MRSVWHQGMRGSYRGTYFRFLGWTLRHHPRKLALALAQACAGHHFLTYTRDTVVPRLRARLEEEEGRAGWPTRGLVA